VFGRGNPEPVMIERRLAEMLIWMYWPGGLPLTHVEEQETFVIPEPPGHPQN